MSFSVDKALRKAQSHLKAGELVAAEELFRQVLFKFPKNQRAIQGYQKLQAGITSNGSLNTGPRQEDIDELTSLYKLGRFEEVLSKVKPLIGLFPKAIFLFTLQGASNAALKRYDAAIENYKQAIKIKPDYVAAYFNMGIALQNKGDLDAAIDSYKQALKIKPDYADAYYNMGVAMHDKGDRDAAIDSYKQALKIKPDYAEAYCNMGVALQEKSDLDAAIDSYKQVLKIKPDYAEAYCNMGAALKDKGDVEAAIDSYNQAINFEPEYQLARTQKMHQQASICDWTGIQEDRGYIPELGISTQDIDPFAILSLEDAPGRHRLRSELYAKNNFKQKPIPLPSRPKTKPSRLRIGYFSVDFHEHPVAYLIAQMLEQHDRGRFEIHAYSLGPEKNDKMRHKIVSAVDTFNDVRTMNDRDIALLVRQDNIDIAIDLIGYTATSRPSIFAYRAAPIQINYLGYPGTMGAEFIDYIIGDQNLIPDSFEEYYSEKVIILPNSYQPNDNTRMISGHSMTKFEMGLPESGFVFCCFNNNFKISTSEFDIWMRLLLKVEGSVLWLLKSNNLAEKNLQLEAEKRGVSSDRLIFAEKIPQSEHLARHRMADLFIDTFNYNAHTTASDALWAGLPVVTKLGQGFAARVAGSLLTAIDLTELITETEPEYEALILDLATNPQRLDAIKQKLAANRVSKPLFNTELFTKHLEDGYQQAYQRYFDGLEPDAIAVYD